MQELHLTQEWDKVFLKAIKLITRRSLSPITLELRWQLTSTHLKIMRANYRH